MTTWRDRLQPEIILTSPNGQQFMATWKGDSRSKEKRLGIFEYPKIPGALVQRMGAGPTRRPITFYFDGPDHDLMAAEFYHACDQDASPWTINHPTHGLMLMDLVSVTEDIQPLESGNITQITTEWIEPMDGGLIPTVPQIEATIQNQVEVVQSQSAVQFADNAVVDVPVSFRNSILTTLAMIRHSIDNAKRTVAAIRSDIDTVYRASVATTQSDVLDLMSLAGELQTLISLPGQMTTDTATRFDFYKNLISNVADITPFRVSVAGLNILVCQELIMTSCLVGIVQTVVDADLSNREDALSYMDSVSGIFIDVTNKLDEGQSLYTVNPIDRQYFSQSQTFNDSALLVAQATQLLLIRSYDLAVAKRFTLAKDRAPLEIAITEGVEIDEFLSTNRLKGDDILLLPAGRQVVVYV